MNKTILITLTLALGGLFILQTGCVAIPPLIHVNQRETPPAPAGYSQKEAQEIKERLLLIERRLDRLESRARP